ncbi:MAG TPA: hypothetical protein VG796_22165 [Verrucomicrobiales bacterium]|jgi:hypothetical protein|nr:hypothetical protein [Verrucomicrobiales bacterium]
MEVVAHEAVSEHLHLMESGKGAHHADKGFLFALIQPKLPVYDAGNDVIDPGLGLVYIGPCKREDRLRTTVFELGMPACSYD